MNENNLLFNYKNNKIKIDFKFEKNINQKYKKIIKLKKNNSSSNLKNNNNQNPKFFKFSNKFSSFINNNNNNLSSNNNSNNNNNFQLKKINNENNNKFLHYNIENDIRFKKIIQNLNKFKPKFLSNQKSTNEILFPKINNNNNNSNSLLIYSDIINDLSENDSFFEENLENLKISDRKIPIKTKLTKNLIELKNKKLTKNFSDLNTDLKNYQLSNLTNKDNYLRRNLSNLHNLKMNNLNKFTNYNNNINKINIKKVLKKNNSEQNFNFMENYKKLKIHFLKVKKKGYEILLKKILDTSNEMKKIKDSIHYEIDKNEKEFESKRNEYVKF